MIELYLFAGMLIAASLSGVAIMLSARLANYKISFLESVGYFLAFRVFMFMGNRDSELTDSFVHFLSVERSKWALATIAVALTIMLVKKLHSLMILKQK